MIKIVTLLRRKAGMSRQDFIRYYESTHAVLAKKLIPGLDNYSRNYIDPGRGAFGMSAESPGFDCVTEIIFPNETVYAAALAAIAKPEVAEAIARDEENLFDRSAIRSYIVEEHRL
jgi:uncharacterized protein (TIGR02118 family)